MISGKLAKVRIFAKTMVEVMMKIVRPGYCGTTLNLRRRCYLLPQIKKVIGLHFEKNDFNFPVPVESGDLNATLLEIIR